MLYHCLSPLLMVGLAILCPPRNSTLLKYLISVESTGIMRFEKWYWTRQVVLMCDGHVFTAWSRRSLAAPTSFPNNFPPRLQSSLVVIRPSISRLFFGRSTWSFGFGEFIYLRIFWFTLFIFNQQPVWPVFRALYGLGPQCTSLVITNMNWLFTYNCIDHLFN